VRVAEQDAGPVARPLDGRSKTEQPLRRRVLVVDDHRDAARILSLLLDTLGHEVRTASSGEQALDEAAQFEPDVIFLDIGLPRLNGYDVARQLRARPGSKRPTLVALTGWGHEDDRKQAMAAGFDHHLVKPVNVSTLRDLLRAAG
jgi:CheY-like chemotaxis protein